MESNLSFDSLFADLKLPKELRYLIDDSHIEEVSASKEARSVDMTLRFFKLPARSDIGRLAELLKEHYDLINVKIRLRFEKNLLDEGYAAHILYALKNSLPQARAFLDDGSIKVSDLGVTVTLKNGGHELLEGGKCLSLIESQIKEEFGLTLKACFDGNLEVKTDCEDYKAGVERELQKCAALPPPQTEGGDKKSQKKQPKKEGSEILLGKPIKGEMTPIESINEESGRVIIIGRCFDFEIREIKNSLCVLSMSLTNGKSSIKASRILKKDDIKDFEEDIKKGKRYLIRGDVEFNRFERDIGLKIFDITILPSEESLRKDEAKEKRVELHLHSNMSAMDAVCSITSYAERAAAFGHRALAITDHGVASAFPEAMAAGKKFGIKMLYGVEAYSVSQAPPALFGKIETLDEYIIFDLETTGLSPVDCAITEIGAVKMKGGDVLEEFSTFVDPERPIPYNITKLTGITDEMVSGAPKVKDALEAFFKFCGNRTLVAHNASFDVGFLKAWSEKSGIAFALPYIDTVAVSRFLFPELKRHKLNLVAQHLKLPPFDHHRASDDARVLSQIFSVMLRKLEGEHELLNMNDLNNLLSGSVDPKNQTTYHQIIFAKNQEGLKNLYKIISFSHIDHFYKKPRVPKSLLKEHRAGLLVGSACDAGELHIAVRDGKSEDELLKIAREFDFLEIQPISNSEHLVASGRVASHERLRQINKIIYVLGKKLGIPVVATGDVHFLDPEDEIFRRILMAGQGFSDADNQPPLYFKTTDEMLSEFSYLGEDEAYEVVVRNPNLVCDMCEDVRPIAKGSFPPEMENAAENLTEICTGRATALYGDPLPDIVRKRLDKELHSIIHHGFAVMYMIAHKLVKKSNEDGYLVGSRGSVGSSLAAFLSGITEVNALAPHYLCRKCKYSEFIEDGSFGTGVDMPGKACPKCGEPLSKDGFDIPFETFLGFDGDKAPDIDLNFSGDYQAKAHKYTEVLFGKGYCFRAGTISTIAQKTAFGFVKKYLDEKGMTVTRAEEDRLSIGCSGVRRTTGQHPGGIIVLPKGKEIYDFCPIQHPADDKESGIITTHFDYHAIDENLLKLDILGHDDPTMIKMLEDLTGVNALEIPLDDPKTMSLFLSNDALKIEPDAVTSKVGSAAIPEFGTGFVKQMLIDTSPKTFQDLLNISGLSHGTDVWISNAQDLVKSGTAALREVISLRDDIMTFLMAKGVEKKLSFDIMESVRKGRGLKEEWEEEMKKNHVPAWYIDSCKKIKYMFPKAHAVAYVMMAFRIAYFKVHYPLEFYAAYFSVRAGDFDAQYMIHGAEVIREKIDEINKNPQATKKEKAMVTELEVCYEFYKRGFSFLPIDLYRSEESKFLVVEGKILPPLMALQGLGETAAEGIVRERESSRFESVEDLQMRAKLSKSVIEIMQDNGILSDIPKSTQLSFF